MKMELTPKTDESMDCEHYSDDDGQDHVCTKDQLLSAFNPKDRSTPAAFRKSMGITFSQLDYGEKQWAEHLGKHLEPVRFRKPTPVFAARSALAYCDRVDAVYRDIEVHVSVRSKRKWKATIVDELLSAARQFGRGCPHYLEPLYYYGDRLKVVPPNHFQCSICKKVFDHGSHYDKHIIDVHSFNGVK